MPDPDDEPDTTQYPYPVDERQQPQMGAKSAVMRAKELNLVVGSRIFDFSNPTQVEAFYDEMRRAAARMKLRLNVVRPEDDGVYHLFWVKPDVGEPYPVLKPEHEALPYLQGIASRDTLETLQQLADRPGLLPLHDPVEGLVDDEDDGD